MLITSPNTVLANSLNQATDIIHARINISNPERIIFSVGTQINGVPHIGTYIVQTATFVLAREIQRLYDIPCEVYFGALDNSPHDIVLGKDGSEYQRAYGHVLSPSDLKEMLDDNYISFFDDLVVHTGISYNWTTYKRQQKQRGFREEFIRSLQYSDQLKWCVAPSNGVMHIRLPSPEDDFYAQKRGEDTKILSIEKEAVIFQCKSRHGHLYEQKVTVTGDDSSYLDLNTLYRNVIKEAVAAKERDALSVMVKGGDWTMSTQVIDWALGALGYSSHQLPMRLFTPQVVTETGAKLSKSLIREGDSTMQAVPKWLIDMSKFREEHDDYTGRMIWLVEQFMSHPRHMYRSYTYHEIMRLLAAYRKEY